jgi:lipopolysaccharide transport system ATP-binding protein
VFQKKCLGKLGDVAQAGRTVLFVSHNMAAVHSLCGRAIWLHEGRIMDEGPPSQVVTRYLQASSAPATERVWPDIATAPGNDSVRLRRVCVRPEHGAAADPITVRTPIVLEAEYWNLEPGARLNISLLLLDEQGVVIFNTGPVNEPVWHGRPFPTGLFRSICQVPGDLLNDGRYRVLLLVVKNEKFHVYRHEDGVIFDVHESSDRPGAWHGKLPGVVRPNLRWTTELLETGTSSPTGLEPECSSQRS